MHVLPAPLPASTLYPTGAPAAAVDPPAAGKALDDVAVMWLFVVQEGRLRKLGFSAADLAAAPGLAVDGFVNGIVLLTKAPMTATVNQAAMAAVVPGNRGEYAIAPLGVLSRRQFQAAFLPPDRSATAGDPDAACYTRFAPVPGGALSQSADLRITLAGSGGRSDLAIRQDAPRRLDVCLAAEPGQGPPEFYYQGGETRGADLSRTDFRERFEAILSGIDAVERAAGLRLVSRVHIVDVDGLNNAYTCEDEDAIWLYAQVVRSASPAVLRTIVEHETWHIFSDRLGLPARPRIREHLAELLGFGPGSWERLFVVATGSHPAPAALPAKAPTADALLDFINEGSFIPGMDGGHARDNTSELCASFLHTLMTVDRLQERLDAQAGHGSGDAPALSSENRVRMHAQYARLLQTMAQEIQSNPHPQAMADFLGHARTTVGGVGERLEALQAAPARLPLL